MPIRCHILMLVAAATASPALAAAGTDPVAASKAQMASMDAYFACAFAAIRASRAKSLDSGGFLAALNGGCAAEENDLRQRSVTFAEVRGMTPAKARATADDAVAAARRDLVRIYVGL